MEIPQKIKNRTTIRPSSPTTGYLSKELEVSNSKVLCTPMFIAALFTIAKMWKQPKCPATDDWIKKMWYIYTHSAILLRHKKRQNRGWPRGRVVKFARSAAGGPVFR